MSTFDLVTKSLLQWGRNFFVTEIGQIINIDEKIILCFNGAVTFSLRKLEFSVPRTKSKHMASMGP